MYRNFYLTLQEMDEQLTQSEVSTDQIENIDDLDVSNLSMDHADELAEQEESREHLDKRLKKIEEKLTKANQELKDLQQKEQDLINEFSQQPKDNQEDYQQSVIDFQLKLNTLKEEIQIKNEEIDSLKGRKKRIEFRKATGTSRLINSALGMADWNIKVNGCLIPVESRKKGAENGLNNLGEGHLLQQYITLGEHHPVDNTTIEDTLANLPNIEGEKLDLKTIKGDFNFALEGIQKANDQAKELLDQQGRYTDLSEKITVRSLLIGDEAEILLRKNQGNKPETKEERELQKILNMDISKGINEALISSLKSLIKMIDKIKDTSEVVHYLGGGWSTKILLEGLKFLVETLNFAKDKNEILKKIESDNQKISALKGKVNQLTEANINDNIRGCLQDYKDLTGVSFSHEKIQKTTHIDIFTHNGDSDGFKDYFANKNQALGYFENLGDACKCRMKNDLMFSQRQKIKEKILKNTIPQPRGFAASELCHFLTNVINSATGNPENTFKLKREYIVQGLADTINRILVPYCKDKMNQIPSRHSRWKKITNPTIGTCTQMLVDAGLPDRENPDGKGINWKEVGKFLSIPGYSFYQANKRRKAKKQQNSELPQVSPDENISTPSQEAIADV